MGPYRPQAPGAALLIKKFVESYLTYPVVGPNKKIAICL